MTTHAAPLTLLASLMFAAAAEADPPVPSSGQALPPSTVIPVATPPAPPPSPATPAPPAATPIPLAPAPPATTAPTPGLPATTAPEKRWFDYITLGALADTYFAYRIYGGFRDQIQLRAFDTQAGTFQVAYARLGIGVKPKPVGFQLDIGFGSTADIATTDPGPSDVFKHIVQGYVSFALPLKRPIMIDVGRFFTSVGSEYLDANQNWNYSHSFLFTYGPITHTGIRILAPVTGWLALQGSVVNGWDAISDGNSFKTLNFSVFLGFKDTALAINYYAGPEKTTRRPPWRHLVDIVLSQPIGKRFAFNVNAEYGREGNDQWYGASLQLNVLIHKFFRLSARGEYLGDPQGNRTGLPDIHLAEWTVTAAVPLFAHGEIRLEGRQDIASRDLFRNDTSRLQTTITGAAIAWF